MRGGAIGYLDPSTPTRREDRLRQGRMSFRFYKRDKCVFMGRQFHDAAEKVACLLVAVLIGTSSVGRLDGLMSLRLYVQHTRSCCSSVRLEERKTMKVDRDLSLLYIAVHFRTVFAQASFNSGSQLRFHSASSKSPC